MEMFDPLWSSTSRCQALSEVLEFNSEQESRHGFYLHDSRPAQEIDIHQIIT